VTVCEVSPFGHQYFSITFTFSVFTEVILKWCLLALVINREVWNFIPKLCSATHIVATYHDPSAIWSCVLKLLAQFKWWLRRGEWRLWSNGPFISINTDDDVRLGNCSQLPHHEAHLCITSFTQTHDLKNQVLAARTTERVNSSR